MSDIPDVKACVRTVLDSLPDDCTIEEVQYRLYVAGQIRRRCEEARHHPLVSHDEVRERLKNWFRVHGMDLQTPG